MATVPLSLKMAMAKKALVGGASRLQTSLEDLPDHLLFAILCAGLSGRDLASLERVSTHFQLAGAVLRASGRQGKLTECAAEACLDARPDGWRVVQLPGQRPTAGSSWKHALHVLPFLSPLQAVAAGDEFTVVASSSGQVYGFGSNDHRQLGFTPRSQHRQLTHPWPGHTQQLVPRGVEGMAGQHVVSVAAGHDFTAVITSTGELWTWGAAGHHLGQGPTSESLLVQAPQRVEIQLGRRVAHVAAGSLHAVCFLDCGAVLSWGDNAFGQLGLGKDIVYRHTPTEIKLLRWRRFGQVIGRVIGLACGEYSTAAVTMR